MSNYGSWTLPELKKELKTRGAHVSGRKRELIERLESYDRNQNFGKETAEDEFNMTLSSSSIYKDMNSETDFSNFTSKSIDIYLEPMGKTLDTKAKQLYNNRFLKYLRLGTENDLFFVKSECHAEMKRKITYKVDVCINKELTIMEAQCECAAGMGPTAHCKHACEVLFGMAQFSCFKELRTEETCTQRLQTFHQYEDITSIQAFTVNQSKSKQWLYERCKRLTSSNFGRICKATDRTDFHKLALSYTRSSALYTAAIKHGRQYEPVAIEKYESITKLETVKCGLLSKMHPFLAASPDGLTENNTLLEIKCPYTARNKLITPKSVPYLSEVNGELILDQKHDYYYQIQGQLFCTGKQTCDFFVYTHEDHKLITIQRNDRFIVEMKDALTSFYEKYFKRVLDKFMYNSYDKYSW
ncbi:Hypothetical predicted protein [Mytilus galloprovincialis]|uniref:SWIM-type domain-containing protein n=1 Tax=Mytilus galloprovincialis TaxID=29158 RepID=A0A8B6CLH6_MYTGA|nr:Hypothetical predicted protein [Mytilus galloprovincialis]